MTDAGLPKDATVGRVDWPDWRRHEAYHYVRRLPRTAWAWEFLRRNPQFQRDHARIAPPACIVRKRADTRIIELTTGSSFLRQWSLLFRGRATIGRPVGNGLLGSARLRPCSTSGRGAGWARPRF
ncbi:transcriptional regulator domain-containing protein [Mesorhizobium kowhaii]|uniref:transcriptional regulator domain-containing protein n=1 Tax=Mesorhizobium kowhaii TaxID=1300272 RepID=UPI003CCAF85C